MVIVVMGVAGVGKTTVGRRLAQRLGWRFHDADDLHAPETIAKLRRGVPLDDEDRAPWLARVRDVITAAAERGEDVVLACSALKQRYREVLTGGIPDVRLVHLVGSRPLLRTRIVSRTGHFMPSELLDSQLRDLEPPEDALVLDASQPVEALVELINSALRGWL